MLGVFPKYRISPRPGSEGYFQGDEIHVDAGTGPYEIAFYFDNGGHDRHWPAGDEIWVNQDVCPPGSGLPGDFTNRGVSAGTLTIRDAANQRGKFCYSLNFQTRSGSPKPWDPVIIHD